MCCCFELDANLSAGAWRANSSGSCSLRKPCVYVRGVYWTWVIWLGSRCKCSNKSLCNLSLYLLHVHSETSRWDLCHGKALVPSKWGRSSCILQESHTHGLIISHHSNGCYWSPWNKKGERDKIKKLRERQKKALVQKKYTFKRRTYYRNNILKK